MDFTEKSIAYFLIYKKIEKEVQELAYNIYFCDAQENVY